jgi:hypothetical protein
MKTTVKRHTESRFEVIIPDAGRSDIDMELVGSSLRMANSIPGIRAYSFHVDLGPKSMAVVSSMEIGSTVVLG